MRTVCIVCEKIDYYSKIDYACQANYNGILEFDTVTHFRSLLYTETEFSD